VSACRSCGKPIEWAVTQLGRRMPLDHGLHPDGRVAVVGATENGTPLVVTLGVDDLALVRELGTPKLRRSHFQTCPDADRWRRT
jgi:hypothetical protein